MQTNFKQRKVYEHRYENRVERIKQEFKLNQVLDRPEQSPRTSRFLHIQDQTASISYKHKITEGIKI